MQSMFRLWSAEQPGAKIMEKSPLHKTHPVVEIPLLTHFKRKATDSPEPVCISDLPVTKKLKRAPSDIKSAQRLANVDIAPRRDGAATVPAMMDTRQHMSETAFVNGEPSQASSGDRKELGDASRSSHAKVAHVNDNSVTAATIPTKTTTMDKTAALQQIIEAEFNHQILIKHNELRFIEQELAKCQIALEQLRRCREVPYPGTDGLSADVSTGTGASLRPRPGFSQPTSPAAWGVTDGPYARHYAKWLLNDPRFDSIPLQSMQPVTASGRSTRHSYDDSYMGRRGSRAPVGSKYHPLGDVAIPTAPKVDPLVHRRSTDNQLVRLRCPICEHSNFSNTQGFLNHCRIKHNQNYKSHDQAAIACGVPVSEDEVNMPPTPVVEHPTPKVQHHDASSPLVHKLITSMPDKKIQLPPRQLPTPSSLRTVTTPQTESAPVSAASSPFVPSPQVPKLSALLQKRNFSGNLEDIVKTARTKVDLSSLGPLGGDEATAEDEPMQKKAKHPGSSKAAARSSTAAASRLPARAPAPIIPPTIGSHDFAAAPSMSMGSRVSSISSTHSVPESPSVELSPNTMESNPGLMSDHGETDDDQDDVRSEMIQEEPQHDVVVRESMMEVDGIEHEHRCDQPLRAFDTSSSTTRK